MNFLNLSIELKMKLVALLSAYLHLVPTSKMEWFCVGAAALILVVITARLRRFVRPDWPIASPFIRWFAQWLAFPIVFVCVAAAVASLPLAVLLAHALGHFKPVYEFLHPFGMNLAKGAITGGVLSIWVWFYAIPVLERRSASKQRGAVGLRKPTARRFDVEKLEAGCAACVGRCESLKKSEADCRAFE
jgi:hypothetical protein